MEPDFSWEEAVSLAREKDKDDNCIAIFHMESMRDQEASEEAGKPIYANVPFVKIIAPGNDKEIVDRFVLQRDKERFPKEWFKFTHNETPEVDGTPIEFWPQLDKAQADTLKANHILSVESLAKVSDQDIGGLGMGMLDLKNKAEIWVEMQDGSTNINKLAEKNRKLEEQVAALMKKVAALEDIPQDKAGPGVDILSHLAGA